MKKATTRALAAPTKTMAPAPEEGAFAEVVDLIRAARGRALQAVNTEMVDLYWRLSEYLHHKIAADGWAKGTVVRLAAYIAQREPGRAASRRRTCGACGSSSRPMVTKTLARQGSQHC